MSTITNRPAFRRPWEHGAKAYHEADTLAALREGAKRKRKAFYVLMPIDGELATAPCGVCDIPLGDAYAVNEGEAPSRVDSYITVDYDPRSQRFSAAHYYCGWGALIQRMFDLRDLGIL